MAAHKLTKKDLKHDGFLDRTEQALEFAQKNATALGIGLLVVVVLIVGFVYVRNSRAAARVQAGVLFHQGENLLAEGQYQTAMIPLQEAVDQYGGTDFGKYARVSLARAMLAVGDDEAALADIERWQQDVPAEHPASRGLKTARAAALANLDRYGDAAAVYDELAATAPSGQERYDMRLRQADCLRRGGQPREALAVLESLQTAVQTREIEVSNVAGLENQITLVRALASQ